MRKEGSNRFIAMQRFKISLMPVLGACAVLVLVKQMLFV
jgi:uncharacterized membrane protein YfbV (UPF0208 family)